MITSRSAPKARYIFSSSNPLREVFRVLDAAHVDVRTVVGRAAESANQYSEENEKHGHPDRLVHFMGFPDERKERGEAAAAAVVDQMVDWVGLEEKNIWTASLGWTPFIVNIAWHISSFLGNGMVEAVRRAAASSARMISVASLTF